MDLKNVSWITVLNHTKYATLNNQQCMTRPNVINLHLNEHSQGLCYYQFLVNLDRCVGNSDTLDHLPNCICVPKKQKIET